MYFPYLRGKQNELALLDECINIIQTNGQIIPIIEPVKSKLNSVTRRVSSYVQQNLPIILIVNPTVGELRNQSETILNSVVPVVNNTGRSHILGYIISERTTQDDISHFIEQTHDNRICFIHRHEFIQPTLLKHLNNLAYHFFIEPETGAIYKQGFIDEQNRVLIKDGFTQYANNASFPQDENFLDINLSYRVNNYVGFGDFLIVGKGYKENGGPAYAVAIHITYRKANGEIGIRHYISDRTTTPQDTAGKFAEALQKLILEKNRRNSPLLSTRALNTFQHYYEDGHFPGLGAIKKISMEHHIELISTID